MQNQLSLLEEQVTKKPKPIKVSLRTLDWPDLITYFTLLPKKSEVFTSKDLVDYFQYKYLCETGMNMWISPNYIKQSACAKKVLSLYGRDFSIALIDIMFEKYRDIFGKEFNQIIWSLGVLSSEKTGWLVEKIIKEYEKKKSFDVGYELKKIMEKPFFSWTLEENKFYEENYLKRKGILNNGKT